MPAEDEEIAARRIGDVLGSRFRLERLLGTGGMAAVYAGRDPQGNAVAVKLMHPELSLRRETRERFLREAYAANTVDHPGVARVLEHGEDGERSAFLVMELLEGESLGAALRRLGTLPTERMLDVADQVLDVLAAAHARGIVHRDLKPDNLFLLPDGRVKVLDFGVARVLDSTPGQLRTQTGLALGTLPYMAPEQALGRRNELDGRADLFALGATLFRVLSGRRIHDAPSEAELLIAMATQPAPRLASVAPGVHPHVCVLVDLALAFSVKDRYPDARTMQEDVRSVRAGFPPAFAVKALAQREAPTRTDLRVPAEIAAAAVAVDAPTRAEGAAPRLGFEPTEPAAARDGHVDGHGTAHGRGNTQPLAQTAEATFLPAPSGPPAVPSGHGPPSLAPELVALPAPPRTGFTRPPLRRKLGAAFLLTAGVFVAALAAAALVAGAYHLWARTPALPEVPPQASSLPVPLETASAESAAAPAEPGPEPAEAAPRGRKSGGRAASAAGTKPGSPAPAATSVQLKSAPPTGSTAPRSGAGPAAPPATSARPSGAAPGAAAPATAAPATAAPVTATPAPPPPPPDDRKAGKGSKKGR